MRCVAISGSGGGCCGGQGERRSDCWRCFGVDWLLLRFGSRRRCVDAAKFTLAQPGRLANPWQRGSPGHMKRVWPEGGMAERDIPPGDLPLRSTPEAPTAERQLSSDENGHVDSPDETLSPTSVIYFKEAYSSSNLRFGNAGSLSPTALPQFDFRIERIDSKRRSECRPTFSSLCLIAGIVLFSVIRSQQLCSTVLSDCC